MGQGAEQFYRLLITAALPSGATRTISAWMPDTFSLDVTSEYDTPAANLVSDTLTGWMDKGLPKAAPLLRSAALIGRMQKGISLVAQDMTAFVWAGSAPWTFTLPFVFTADTDAKLDVTHQIRDLMMMVAPRRGNLGMLISPGPTIDIMGLAIDFANEILKAGIKATVGQSGADSLVKGFSDFTNSMKNQVGTVITELDNFANKATAGVAGVQGAVATMSGAAVNVSGQRADNTMQSANDDFRSSERTYRQQSDAAQAKMDDWGMWSSHIKNNIRLRVGQFIQFPSVVITDVGSVYNTIFDQSGNPVRAMVNVTFKTLMTPTQDDLARMFLTADPPIS